VLNRLLFGRFLPSEMACVTSWESTVDLEFTIRLVLQLFDDVYVYGGGVVSFDCVHQGISEGWADQYHKNLDCQWIDVTDVPIGMQYFCFCC
jgi:hypothetical protein